MFDFWKEVIINSDDRLETVKNAAGEDIVRVTRCADYNPKNVVDGIVYKTACVEGVCARVNLKGLISVESRVAIELGLSVGQDSEFARPWFAFKKPFVVEAKDEAGLIKALREAIPTHIGRVVVGEGTAELVINDPKVCVKNVKIAILNADGTEWKNFSDVTEDAVTPNVVPVGTGEWILENLRFPTHVNTRVAAPNADDMPVAGGKYTQYAFEYCVSKRGAHGSGAVGQPLASVTHHVFYVLDGVDASALEGLAAEGGLITIPKNEKAYSTVRYEKVVGGEAAKATAAKSPVTKDNE